MNVRRGCGLTAIPILMPLFTGISLEVTPQVDDSSHMVLHVRPSVTSVTEKTKEIGLGGLGSQSLPGVSDLPVFSTLFGNKGNTGRKKEVVVLIKPTIIRDAKDWEDQTRLSREALSDMDRARARVIRIDGSVKDDGLPTRGKSLQVRSRCVPLAADHRHCGDRECSRLNR